MDTLSYDELSFLHFNDVYHITQPTALGRLSHVFRKAKDAPESERPIIVFSGDAFSPSLESAVLKGEHMVPVLNHLLIDVACYGNHDFDFGEEALVKLSRACTFPWLLANAVHDDGSLLASSKELLVLEKKGYRIGFFGLAGTDWPSNCQHLPADCTILDPVFVARRLARTLRSTYDVDIVIAITHMRHEEDLHLSQTCSDDVDLIFGGHDHDLTVHGTNLKTIDDTRFEGPVKLVKSGTDFKSFSAIKVHLIRKNGKASLASIMRNITLTDGLPEDCGIQTILSALQARIADAVDRPLFQSAVPLDGRTSAVRTKETNLGNMLADAVRAYYDTDIAFINSGSVRCDRIINAGIVTVKDMIDILPFDNPFVIKRLDGHTIRQALENAVCDIIDGRFFQVSGIIFHIDPQAPVGARVHGVYLTPSFGQGHGHGDASVYVDADGDAYSDGDHGDADSRHHTGMRGTTGTPAAPPYFVPCPFLARPSDACPPVGSSLTTPEPALNVIGPDNTAIKDNTNEPARPSQNLVLLRDHATYTVTISAFIAAGFDGFGALKDVPTLVDQDAEGVMTDSSLLLHIFSRRNGIGASLTPGFGTDAVGTMEAFASASGPRGQYHAMERARAAIVLETTVGGLPVVSPSVQGRIRYVIPTPFRFSLPNRTK